MKQDTTVLTSNIIRLMKGLHTLTERAQGGREEGMGILYGRPGEGKTTAIAYAVTQTRAIYLRANVTLTVTTLLELLCQELMVTPSRARARMLAAIGQELAMDPRPILVDEADYVCRPSRASRDMLDVLRDVYDLARVPVLLVGLPDDEMVRLLRPAQEGALARFSRRITERIPFDGLHLVDAQRVAGELCEIEVEGAQPPGGTPVPGQGTLVEHLHREAQGNIGRLVTALGEVERWARLNGLSAVSLADYTAR